ARAYYDAGMSYYPKIVVGIPFTPANGQKILVDENYNFEQCASLLIQKLMEFGKENKISSIHFLFITEKEKNLLKNFNFLERLTHQYHWHNRGYDNFDDFLGDLRSGKRKQIKKERKYLNLNNVETEVITKDNISRKDIDSIWEFYVDTNSKKWGNAYLNRSFFEIIFEVFKKRTVLIIAKENNTRVGGTVNFFKNTKLYGRYWGCNRNIQFLHFECCYYKLIEFSIKNKIEIFEAGAQGEHKFLRGFSAVPIISSHFLFHKGAYSVISDFLNKEKLFTQDMISRYNNQSPLKHLYGNQH
ncbi:MAG: GNAT family N-acetyltransferase, partial [Candidatus Dadabacteria bacterium]|nr:GNAT family N-acetyltransferase [Candidatus Dadabacteria bacterium]NIQ15841.1 GNAT family N-acetyltransferase [Candidatus Dadabacteria bacterium]